MVESARSPPMKAEQVGQALLQKFVTEGVRLVFWHDR